ncbi:MAG TPA: L,D-transpeptidase family protein [Longimicrobium sp.]|nr:L,D-transpeptidase family protein [Longimicrobium sp.]
MSKTHRTRAAQVALTLACILALPWTPARAQGGTSAPGGPSAPVLPAMHARPPASRAAAGTPGVPVARPGTPATPAAPGRLVRRPAVAPALNPTSPLDLTRVKANGETVAHITADEVNGGRMKFPVGPGLRGPSVLRVQVLLNRAQFAPGMLDGGWGQNTGVAVYWFQAREGLTPNGVVDSATYARLEQVAGRPRELVAKHTLSAADVRGPYVSIPGSIYAQARMNCLCYESLAEKLSEMFASRVELLQRLNPGVSFDSLKAGDVINVPNVRDPNAPPKGVVETLVVSGADHYLQALDANGRILYHFPITIGSSFDPSPEGSFHVLAITENPWWHYQPSIIKGRNPNAPNAHVPPGPNNSVGRVWMTLSAPHYGIHGTKSPETIGYAVSAGCVRLANWDALYLARRLTRGTPVVFRGTRTAERQNVVNRTPGAPTPSRPAVAGVRVDSARRAAADSARRDSTRRDSARTAQPDSTRAPVKTDSTPTKPDSAASAQPAPTAAPATPTAPVAAPQPDTAAAARP